MLVTGKRAITLTHTASSLLLFFVPPFRVIGRQSLPAIDMAVFPAVIGDEAWDSTIPSPPPSRPLNLDNDSGGEAAVPAAAEVLLLQEGQRRRQRQNEGRILPWEGGGVEVEAEDDTLSSSRVVLRPAVLPSSPSITACSFSSLSLSASALSRSPSPSPSSSLPALRHINLGRCYGVTDRALARVAGAFPGLEGVRLEYCLRVTDVGVAALAAGCPGLKALGLRNCGQVLRVGWGVRSGLSVCLCVFFWGGRANVLLCHVCWLQFGDR